MVEKERKKGWENEGKKKKQRYYGQTDRRMDEHNPCGLLERPHNNQSITALGSLLYRAAGEGKRALCGRRGETT